MVFKESQKWEVCLASNDEIQSRSNCLEMAQAKESKENEDGVMMTNAGYLL